MKNKICLVAFILFNISISIAQDYHLTQFDANPLFLNPALTGERLTSQNGVRFSAIYRDQTDKYSKTSASYNTMIVGIDSPISNRLSIGQYIGNNRSADGGFNSFNLLLSGSYKLISSKDEKNRQNLSVGLQAGLLNNSINTQKFIYASQYSPTSLTGFDNTLSSGEAYSQYSYTKFDCNFGVYYRLKFKNDKSIFTSGFSFYHIGENNDVNNLDNTIGIRRNLHASLIYNINSKVKFTPQFLYMDQYKSSEFNYGFLLNYKLKEAHESIIGFSLLNTSTAVYQFGMIIKGTTFRASYSMPLNFTRNYSNKGLEFSLVHIFNKNVVRVKIESIKESQTL
jgi:type IX secretion system PorP/SprF family membrane protein